MIYFIKNFEFKTNSIYLFFRLITKADDIKGFLPYIFSVVAERVNCHDLEGIQHLPEVMKPPPG
jgi:hypothetical protein